MGCCGYLYQLLNICFDMCAVSAIPSHEHEWPLWFTLENSCLKLPAVEEEEQ